MACRRRHCAERVIYSVPPSSPNSTDRRHLFSWPLVPAGAVDGCILRSSSARGPRNQFCFARPLRRRGMDVQPDQLRADSRPPVPENLWPFTLACLGSHDGDLLTNRLSVGLLHRSRAQAVASHLVPPSSLFHSGQIFSSEPMPGCLFYAQKGS